MVSLRLHLGDYGLSTLLRNHTDHLVYIQELHKYRHQSTQVLFFGNATYDAPAIIVPALTFSFVRTIINV